MQKLVNGELVDMTAEEISAREVEVAQWEADKLANDYIDKRKAEYPNIGDQLDALWKQHNQDRLNGNPKIQEIDDMLGDILAVKSKYPKGE